MTPIERCHQILIDLRHEVAATQPPGPVTALLALLRFGDVTAIRDEPTPSARPGWKLALRLCLELQDEEHREVSDDRFIFGRSDSSPTATSWRSQTRHYRGVHRASCNCSSAIPAPSSRGRRAGATRQRNVSVPTLTGGRRTSPGKHRPA